MVMNVKSKVMAALGSIKDQAAIGRASIAGRNILSSIEIAVLRSTDSSDTSPDDKHMREIFFLVSNAPGSITFLARKLSTRLESTRDPVVALKTLLLLHRLLRGGDRYFEQDLRNLWSSGDLHIDVRWLASEPDPFFTFIRNYSQFLAERMEWLINQAGKLEPVRPISGSGVLSYNEKAIESVLHRLSKCQALIDRIIDCQPISNSRSSHAMQSAMNVVLRESFRVYESSCEGIDVVFSSLCDLKKHTKASALDILRKSCTQTCNLHDFYEKCKKCVAGKSLGYPSVRIITSDEIPAMDHLETREESKDEEIRGQQTGVQSCGSSISPFSLGLETKISMVWVEFSDEEDSERCSFSMEML